MSSRNKKIRGCGFHHVSMRVRDLDKSITFYTEGLGFIEQFSWGQDPKRTILLDTGDGNYFEISQGDPDRVNEDGVFGHIALRVDDCKAALENARKAGAEVTVETRDVTLSSEPPIPIRIAFFKGPDGELIELFQDDHT
ncbi:MAG: VOC family protein [Candidatus Bathyarchaeia archaeon]